MSAHAGVFFFDGRPVSRARDVIERELRPLASADVRTHAAAGIVIAHVPFAVWAGEDTQQPLRTAAGLVLAWDGRLDNREDLLRRLPMRPAGEHSDATIVLSAFEHWGTDGLSAIVGDWSAAIWNARERLLHLARDVMGIRPLYYRAGAQWVEWSTDLGEIAHRTGADVSDEFAAAYVTGQLTGGTTPYHGVRAVGAGTCVSFSSAGQKVTRFGDWPSRSIRFADRRRYEEELRAHWSTAVACRLRSPGVVWAELSGGLDSSAVVCMAHRLTNDGRAAARAIQPISYVTLESPEGDERRFIADVENQIDARAVVLGVEEHQHAADPDSDWVTPDAAHGVGLAAARHVLGEGGRLMLSGRLGDLVMGCVRDNSVAVLDDIAAGRVFRALARIRRWSRACQKPYAEIVWRLASELRSPSLAPAIVHAIDARGDGLRLLAARMHAFVPDAVARLVREASRQRPSKRELFFLLLAYASESRFNVPYTRQPLVYAYPFTHRPLIEFVLGIPGEELSAPGDTRSLMRRAFAGLMPPRILQRTSKGYYPPSTLRRVREIARTMRPVERLQIVQREWIDRKPLEAALGAFIEGGTAGPAVRSAIDLERWLRSRERRAAATIPSGASDANAPEAPIVR